MTYLLFADIPYIYNHIHHFNTEINEEVEIQCVYTSYPQEKFVKWFREGQLINESKKYHITSDLHNNKHRTKLLIKNVNKNDITKYTCEIEVKIFGFYIFHL